MPARRKDTKETETTRKRATTPEGREHQLVADAIDLAEHQIRNRTASSQVITHFLKMGSTREVLEQERLRHENELTRVKIEAIEGAQRMEELYLEAIKAMRTYAGDQPALEDDVQD